MKKKEIQEKIETFIRSCFNLRADDPEFSHVCDLFENGYVDSFGIVKLISYLEKEFKVSLDEDYLYDERFLTIDGQSEIVLELMDLRYAENQR